jgi:hypothetical protein
MKPCAIALWCANGEQFAHLRGVLTVLFRRADAFNTRDVDAYGRILSPTYADRGRDRAQLLAQIGADFRASPPARVSVRGWQLRVERDIAEAGEDYDLTMGEGPPRRLRALYQLRREGDRWLITAGL